MMLFWKECKKVICSISYLIFVILLVIALYSQGAMNYKEDILWKPQPGENYGVKSEEIPELIMPAALEALYQEFSVNSYVTYPVGFYKNVKLSDSEQEVIASILSELTGVSREKLLESCDDFLETYENEGLVIDGDTNLTNNEDGSFSVSRMEEQPEEKEETEEFHLMPRENLSYDEFREAMAQVDDILGGGSDYAADSLIGFGTVPITYEEAVEAYEQVKEFDRFTGGYARLFSDYAGCMVLSIFPVFLSVVLSMKDRRAKMAELIYTRNIFSVRLVFVRYAAILAAVMLPVVILSYISNLSVWGMYSDMKLDYLAPFKYDIVWLLPSVMISSAVGICLTEWTNTPIAVAVQGLWWFVDVNMGIKNVESGYALLRLAPRHNAGVTSQFRTQDFVNHFGDLIANRALMAGVAILLIFITVVIYEAKRRGKLNGSSKIKHFIADISNRRNQSAA